MPLPEECTARFQRCPFLGLALKVVIGHPTQLVTRPGTQSSSTLLGVSRVKTTLWPASRRKQLGESTKWENVQCSMGNAWGKLKLSQSRSVGKTHAGLDKPSIPEVCPDGLRETLREAYRNLAEALGI